MNIQTIQKDPDAPLMAKTSVQKPHESVPLKC